MFAALVASQLAAVAGTPDPHEAPATATAEGPHGGALPRVRRCLAQAPPETAVDACVGRWGKLCQTAPEHITTVGISACVSTELDAWETLRAEVSAKLELAAQRYDREVVPEGAPSVSSSLAAPRTTWEAHRAVQRTDEWSECAGGTMRGSVALACKTSLPARRFGYLVEHGRHQKHFDS